MSLENTREHGNGPSQSIRCLELPEYLSDRCFLKNY
jgi:hypothetical protein